LGVLLLAQASCTATFHDGVAAGPEQTAWSHFFVYGAIGHDEVDARDLCESARLSRVRTGDNALTLGAKILTLGIYAPRRVVYACEEVAK
jgi:hypothetical protein